MEETAGLNRRTRFAVRSTAQSVVEVPKIVVSRHRAGWIAGRRVRNPFRRAHHRFVSPSRETRRESAVGVGRRPIEQPLFLGQVIARTRSWLREPGRATRLCSGIQKWVAITENDVACYLHRLRRRLS